LEKKIKGAVEMPQAQIEKRYTELPKDKLIVVYCWDTWCSLAAKAAVFLLEKGFKVKELYGGTMAWKTLSLPLQPMSGFTGKRDSNSPNRLIK
jgi:rhodanese-related sulfurtransferase